MRPLPEHAWATRDLSGAEDDLRAEEVRQRRGSIAAGHFFTPLRAAKWLVRAFAALTTVV